MFTPFPELDPESRVQASAEAWLVDLKQDLGVGSDRVVEVGAGSPPRARGALLVVDAGTRRAADATLGADVLRAVRDGLSPEGHVLVVGHSLEDAPHLCQLRNALWPHLHVVRAYRMKRGEPVLRIELGGSTKLPHVAEADGFAVLALERLVAMSPATTAQKFDKNAAGWNGVPGAPDYAHFRWMRKLLAVLGKPRSGETALDAGSGAGWVGIEAAKLGASVSSFDPSPEMVKFVLANAASEGVRVEGRVGFCEKPPFSGPFDLVLNSGVISFSPDADVFLDGLCGVVKPGGRLVIGDLNPRSRGMTRRRTQKPIVPVRELNASLREDVERGLERRGFTVDWRRFYQLTSPVPELIHRSKNRMVQAALLAANRVGCAVDGMLGSPLAPLFDSWIIGATKRAR